MKKSLLLFFALAGVTTLFSQTTPSSSSFGIKFDGFVREDAIFDTRQVDQLREGMFLLYPLNSSLDKNGADINARSSFNMIAIGARLSGKISGPDVFGAKTSGLLEGEFFGATNANINTFRLRHAFVKLNWTKTELLFGQTWHTLFTDECVPGTLNFNTGSPFQPFSRAPQIRVKQTLAKDVKFSFATLTQRDFTSTGPAGAGYQYLSNASLPEFGASIYYQRPKTDSTSMCGFGLVGEYKQLLPRLVTDSNVKATNVIESYAVSVYGQFENKHFGIKVKATYGGNLYDQMMLGGYAINYDSIARTDANVTYTPIMCGAAWMDAYAFIGKTTVGLFAGYTQNMGSNVNIQNWNTTASYYSRGSNIAYVYRISPRVTYSIKSLKFGAEYDYTVAAYGNKRNSLGVVEPTNTAINATLKEVPNNRILGFIQYNF